MTGSRSAFVIRRHTPLSPAAAFAAVADFPGHANGVPFTHVETTPGPPSVGWSFTAITALGPLGFRDPMVLTRWDPPDSDGRGGYALRKTGRILAGWAAVDVAPAASGGTEVRWAEQIDLRPRALGVLTAPASRWAGGRILGQALDALLARAEREASA
jgi:Polyketide cyclase / dehydrase and lipid transport